MSSNSRRYGSGPWRDQYYPYERQGQEQWHTPNNAYNNAYYADNYNYGYGYDNNDQYYGYAPSSSQSNDYYSRGMYEDTGFHQYSYTTNERQPARYDEREYYHNDHHSSPTRRRWQDHGTRDNRHSMASKSKPAPYTYERDDRSVTPPPRRSPSPSYLKLADEPPQSLHSTEGQRKLLILDLNGTLVHRSALHRPKHRGAPQSASALDKNGRPLPKLRPVHPRPYMTAFRSYLFAPETRAWLDVMVWSSAQPHSVGDMVEKCFASDKEKLLAVWARDTLGLPKDHYYRKVQTVKDLNTPWTKLPSLSRSYDSDASSSDESPRRPRPHPDTVHSAFTTLLLDDSPRKAELQPYNHVCIPEYSGEMRANDLEVLRTEKILADSNQDVTDTSPEFDDFSAEAPAKSEDPTLSPGPDGDTSMDNPRKRKRKDKKEAKRQQALLEAQSEHENKAYDETLLAVIGVLDEIKSQRNVAAWIRSGGLLRTYGTSRSSANVVEKHGKLAAEGSSQSSPPVSQETFLQQGVDRSPDNIADADGKEDDAVARGNRQTRQKEGERGGGQMQAAEVEGAAHGTESLPSGNDVISTVDSHTTTTTQGSGRETVDTVISMWFERPETVQSWVEKGKKALKALRIPVEHGIDH